MSHNYGANTRSLVQVRTDSDGLPKGFSWRGRKYVVLAILFSWLEAALGGALVKLESGKSGELKQLKSPKKILELVPGFTTLQLVTNDGLSVA